MTSKMPRRIDFSEDNFEDLDHLWQPFLNLSRALGTFPFVPERVDDRPYRRKLWNFYSIFVLCALCGRLCWIVTVRVVGGGSITLVDVDFLSITVFPIHLIATTVGFIYFLNFSSHLNDMRHLWSSLTFTQDTSAKVICLIKRKMKLALALCAVALTQVAYGIGSEFFRMFHFGLPVSDALYELFLGWSIIIHVLQTGLFCTLCCAISCLLQGFSQDMEIKIAKDNMGHHLNSFKNIYTTVIDFIQVSNQLFGFYVGLLVISSLLQACFDTYTLVVYTSIHKNISGIVIWVVYNLLTTVVVCLSAGEIPDQAKRPYRTLLKQEFSRCSTFQQNEILLLLDCFKNLEANISMFRIIPITKETLPTIVSVYFTYMILLFQFPSGHTNVFIPQNDLNDSIS